MLLRGVVLQIKGLLEVNATAEEEFIFDCRPEAEQHRRNGWGLACNQED